MSENKVRFSDIKRHKSENARNERDPQDKPRRPVAFRLGGSESVSAQSKPGSPLPDPEPVKDSGEISHGADQNKDQNQFREKAGPAESGAGKAVYHGDLRSLLNLEAWKRNPSDSAVCGKEPEAGPGPEEDEPLRMTLSEGEEHNQIYAGLESYLRQIKAEIQNGSSFPLDAVSGVIGRIIENPGVLQRIYPLTIPIHDGGDYNISHQVNTMIYAIKIGAGFSWPVRRLHELALSALLHDVGMFLIPEEITGKSGKLSAGDLAVVKKHPVMGREILSAFDQIPWLAEVAYQHHERENGQGYPLGLKGDQIGDYAKIIGIVDSYEAMTHNRPYRKALMQAFSAQELIKSKNLLFSPAVIKVFLREISIYPLGSYVRLNNRAIGQVVGTDQTRPLRPDVRIIFDGEGNPVEKGSVIKLDENPIFFIQDSVAEEELPSRR